MTMGRLVAMGMSASMAGAMLLAGCASMPAAAPMGRMLQSKDAGLQPAAAFTAPAPQWWREAADPQLDRLMAAALVRNPTLEEARARVRLAEARVDQYRAGRRPQIGVDIDETRQRLSEKAPIPPPFGGQTVWLGEALANLTWSLDLAGRQAALIAAARADRDARLFDVAAARSLLSGAVAQTYVNLARAEQHLAIARAFRQSREEALRLERVRLDSRLASNFDERAAATLLATAQQAEIRAAGARQLMVHALVALAGDGMDGHDDIGPASIGLATMLPVPDVVPADLLARRPDILAARARVDAALAGRQAARAEFYPNVDLRLFGGLSAVGLGALFTGSALTYGAGPAMHLPLFQGGRLRANLEGATAETDVAIARYNGLVLQAVREAADAIAAMETAQDSADTQRAITASLSDTVRLDAIRVRTGLGSRLDAIASGERLLTARQDQVDIDADGAIARIQLIVALGGGFAPMDDTLAAASAGTEW